MRNLIQIEAALIHSQYILEPTIKSLGLNIAAYPKHLPVIWKFFANKNNSIKVSKFNVPQSFWGTKFYIELKDQNKYHLLTQNNDLILEGEVGKLATTGANDVFLPKLNLLVDKLDGDVGAKFVILSRSIIDSINSINSSLVITDIGQNPAGGVQGSKTDTGILDLSFTGTDPVKIPKILNAILYYEVAKNTEKKSAEIEKTLEFLNKQLPELKKNLDIAETNLSNYRGKKGSLGLNTEGSAYIGTIS